MNYSTPFAPKLRNQTRHPRLVSLLAGFGISFIIGILLGLLGSVLFSLINQNGGMEWLAIPVVIIHLVGTAVISFFAIKLIDKKINPNR